MRNAFFAGLRAGKIVYTTEEIINSLMFNKRCEFYQSKVNSMRTCSVSGISSKYFELIQNDVKEVFSIPNPDPDNLVLLYPFIKTSKDKWLKLLNDKLRIFAKKYNLRLSSHSFRISYVTRILKYSSIDRAQSFVGHRNAHFICFCRS